MYKSLLIVNRLPPDLEKSRSKCHAPWLKSTTVTQHNMSISPFVELSVLFILLAQTEKEQEKITRRRRRKEDEHGEEIEK